MNYNNKEEFWNIRTHVFAWLLSLVGLVLMLVKVSYAPSIDKWASAWVYGLSLSWQFAASSIYHSRISVMARRKWRIIDHSSIYVLIAGTYTPFCLISLPKEIGIPLLYVCWTFAAIGMIFKIFFTGKWDKISTLIYVFMGWLVVFAYKSFLENVPPSAILWMVAGGIMYTVGALLYVIKKIPYNHAIFHVFVNMAALCHFIAIYEYVL